MNFENQILFFFSALGAFNGLFLSLYFAFLIKNKNRTTYFLSGLLFVISVRVTKSVFLTFYPETSSLFIQIGLTACFLIGPFLYLYTRIATKPEGAGGWNWLIHIVPIIIFMVVTGILYPYNEYWHMWQRKSNGIFGLLLFTLWTSYVVAAIYQVRFSFIKLVSKEEKPRNLDYWLINIVIGVFIIWLAYNTARYTSYVVGALSFSFTFYLTLLIWFFKRRKNSLSFLSPAVKYANKKIDNSKALNISSALKPFFEDDEIHRNPNLKLSEVAQNLNVTTHELSQYFNENLGMGFSNYVNSYRIASAKKMLESNDLLTLEAIGNECGFRSNSTFYAAFKKINGVTPSQYKKTL